MSMTVPDVPRDTRHPYGDHADAYWHAGWHGVLPLPAGAKKHPPAGYTGAAGAWPSYPDVHAWSEDHPAGNLALRMSPGVLGIDVDAYGDKPGGLVLQEHERNLGPLPATWRTTSRDDGVSGILLYRVPEGLRWPSVLGPGIEIIRTEHRYAVAWPSIHPDTGHTYRWINPAGVTVLGEIPSIDDLPHLPDEWVTHFTGGELAADQAHADLSDTQAAGWLAEHGQGALCRHTDRALTRGLTDLAAGTSRHDGTLTLTNRLVWLAGEGHAGATTALQQTRHVFLTAVTGDRAAGEAESEWDRMIAGAVRITAAAHPDPGPDPCDLSFLIPRKDQPCRPSATATPTGPTTPAPATDAGPATGTSPDAPATSTGTASTETAEHTSWWPVDLTDALHGHKEPPPAHLARDDGHAAFYPARVNGLIGPSESGKTWIAMHAVTQAIERREHITILDFEDSPAGVIGRLLALGVTPDQIREHVAYIGPDERYNRLLPAGADLAEHLDQWAPQLILIDGFNAAMSLQGLNLLDNMEATLFFQTVLKPLSKNGATVIYVDHTPKDKGNVSAGGIGAQAKRAMTTGCTLKVEVIKAFGKGQSGKLRLYVDKDRQGDVRGTSAPGKAGHWFGDFNVDGHPDGTLTVQVDAPEGLNVDHADAYEFRPTHLMERISDRLAAAPDGLSKRQVTKSGGKESALAAGLDILEREGYVTSQEATGRGGTRVVYVLERPFPEALDGLTSPEVSPRRPSVAQVSPGDTSGDPSGKCRPSPSPPTGTGDTSAAPADDASEGLDGTKCRPDEEAFCKHCGTDITEDLHHAPGLTRCRHCRHLIDGSERRDR